MYAPIQTQAHLSGVYLGKSRVNNDVPKSLMNPPPWANLDPRVLSPIPDKKKREACWDDSFARGSCLQRKEVPGGPKPTVVRKRPASAGIRRGHQEPPSANIMERGNRGNRGNGGAKQPQGGTKSRPSFANAPGRDAACGNVGNSDTTRRSSDADVQRSSGVYGALGFHARGCSSRRSDSSASGGDNGSNNRRKSCGAFSAEEKEILAGSYRLNERQEATFRDFVAMLVDFDTCSMVRIIDDVFRETQLATGLQDFTGCGED